MMVPVAIREGTIAGLLGGAWIQLTEQADGWYTMRWKVSALLHPAPLFVLVFVVQTEQYCVPCPVPKIGRCGLCFVV